MSKRLSVSAHGSDDAVAWPVLLLDDEHQDVITAGLSVESFEDLALMCEQYDAPAILPPEVMREMIAAGEGGRHRGL
jgi:hypothetical protein